MLDGSVVQGYHLVGELEFVVLLPDFWEGLSRVLVLDLG